jgi:23S rRNA pseudouridine2605 synthase
VKLGGGAISESQLRVLRDGVELDDGPTAPARVRRLAADEIELTIREGRNRQVRRMCEAVEHPVVSLVRVRFGPLSLGTLAAGAHRRLREVEVERLRALSL